MERLETMPKVAALTEPTLSFFKENPTFSGPIELRRLFGISCSQFFPSMSKATSCLIRTVSFWDEVFAQFNLMILLRDRLPMNLSLTLTSIDRIVNLFRWIILIFVFRHVRLLGMRSPNLTSRLILLFLVLRSKGSFLVRVSSMVHVWRSLSGWF